MHISPVSFGCVSFGLTMLLSTGAWAQKVTTDYPKDVDFSRYKTFMWIKQPKTADPLMQRRIVDDVSAALTAKGLTPAASDADLAIAAHTATREERSLDTFYNGFGGGWRWGGGFGSATTRVNRYEVGSLVVDIFDGRTKEALWRGTATKMISDDPEKNIKSLNKALASMFKAFPPQSRAHAN